MEHDRLLKFLFRDYKLGRRLQKGVQKCWKIPDFWNLSLEFFTLLDHTPPLLHSKCEKKNYGIKTDPLPLKKTSCFLVWKWPLPIKCEKFHILSGGETKCKSWKLTLNQTCPLSLKKGIIWRASWEKWAQRWEGSSKGLRECQNSWNNMVTLLSTGLVLDTEKLFEMF